MSTVEVETSEVAPGARCAVHPETAAVAVCSRCGSYACGPCTRGRSGKAFCAACADALPALATPGRRLAGSVLDSLIIAAPVLICLAIGIAVSAAKPDVSSDPLVFTLIAVGGAGSFTLLGWNGLFVYRYSQSLAKRWLGMRVVRSDGSRATFGRIVILRNFVPALLGNVPILGGIFSIVDACFIFREDRRCIHDLIADTIVVDAKEPRAPGPEPLGG